jgi:dolichol-phosphate mannosyltransferase
MTGVRLHDHNCGMKCYRREVLGEVRLYGELHRFVPVLAAGRGFRIGELAIEHRARVYGQSKYGMGRFTKGFLDLLTVKFLTGYGQRPQHLLGTIGLTFFILGGSWLLYLTGAWIVSRVGLIPGMEPILLHERPALIYASGLLVLGGQFMSIGFLGELFVAYRNPEIKSYSISESTPSHPASQDKVP